MITFQESIKIKTPKLGLLNGLTKHWVAIVFSLLFPVCVFLLKNCRAFKSFLLHLLGEISLLYFFKGLSQAPTDTSIIMYLL